MKYETPEIEVINLLGVEIVTVSVVPEGQLPDIDGVEGGEF